MEKFDFPIPSSNIMELPIKTAVFVPSTEIDKKVSPARFRKRIRETRNFLDRTFGGSTRMKGVGSWESSKSNKIIDEDVVIVESFSTKPNYLKNDQLLRDFIQKKLVSWKQQAISVEYKNKLYIIQ